METVIAKPAPSKPGTLSELQSEVWDELIRRELDITQRVSWSVAAEIAARLECTPTAVWYSQEAACKKADLSFTRRSTDRATLVTSEPAPEDHRNGANGHARPAAAPAGECATQSANNAPNAPNNAPIAAPKPVGAPMPCGHPSSAVIGSDEGTHYCGDCDQQASTAALLAQVHALTQERDALADECARQVAECARLREEHERLQDLFQGAIGDREAWLEEQVAPLRAEIERLRVGPAIGAAPALRTLDGHAVAVKIARALRAYAVRLTRLVDDGERAAAVAVGVRLAEETL